MHLNPNKFNDKSTMSIVPVQAVANISDQLDYTTPRTMFSTFSEQLLLSWLRDQKELRHFPSTIFSYSSLFEFYKLVGRCKPCLE